MAKTTRRDFMKHSILSASALATSSAWAGDAKGESAVDRIELGQTGIKVPHVAMGTGFNGYRRSSAQTRAGFKSFQKLVRHGFEQGLNFFDMADLYGSHPYMKIAMEGVPRDQLVYLSKIWYRGGEGFESTETAKPKVHRFLQELGTDYLDVCLIHCLGNANWTSELDLMREEMAELKEKGVVRAVGCSCHDFGALKVAAEDPWVDVIFARINPHAKSMDVREPERVKEVAATLKKARANGKAVVGMKIYGAGKLVEKEQRDESLRFVWGNGLVDAMTIGFEKPEQVNDTIDHLTQVLKA